MILDINIEGRGPIVVQIEQQIRTQIENGKLLAGTRLPSVRQLATQLRTSPFTIVTAYDRLTASNFVRSRRGAGYFVAERQIDHAGDAPLFANLAVTPAWLLRALKDPRMAIKAGAGVLPPDWLDNDAVKRAARFAVRTAGSAMLNYPTPEGYRPLRNLLAHRLIDQGVSAQPDQIVLTNGASHALDLVVRTVLERGAAVAVEEPGYYRASCLKEEGVPCFPVPRTADGLDLEALDSLLQRGQVKLVLVNSILQNPTGTTISPINAHRLVALAEKYRIHIVEDDIYGDFHKGPTFRVANLDQLNRVIYVSSFSKTLSADFRCGFVAAHKQIARALIERKGLTGIITSELNERIVTEFLASGEYRRQIERFRQKLTLKRTKVITMLRGLDFDVPLEPSGGFFVWARLRTGRSADKLAQSAISQGLVLAPGSVFSLDRIPSSWLRFNVAHCDTVDFERRLKASLAACERS